MIFPENGGCLLHNPDEENRVYKKKIDFSGIRFITSCGKWLLMLDSQSRFYIIDVFTEKRIDDLPPLDRVVTSNTLKLERVGVKKFIFKSLTEEEVIETSTDAIKGRLWVDEKAKDFSVVWFFDAPACFLCVYKKGNDHYDYVSVGFDIPMMLTGLEELVLRGSRFYFLTTGRRFLRVLDFSQGSKDEIVLQLPDFSLVGCDFSIAATKAGEVLFVVRKTIDTFRVYKKDPNEIFIREVDSLGDDVAVVLDLGITVPVNPTLGIKPNSIYFSHHDRKLFGPSCGLDQIMLPCEYNLVTKTQGFSMDFPSDLKEPDSRHTLFLPYRLIFSFYSMFLYNRL